MKKIYKFTSEDFEYRTIGDEDANTIALWRSDYNIIKYFFNTKPVDLKAHMKWYYEIYLKDDCRYDFIVCDNKIPVGVVALTHINHSNLSSEINYFIGNDIYRGHGYGTQLINAIVRFGHESLNICSYIAEIHRDNIPSQKSALRAGFVVVDKTGLFWKYARRI